MEQNEMDSAAAEAPGDLDLPAATKENFLEGVKKAERFMLRKEQDWLVLAIRPHVPKLRLYHAVLSKNMEALRAILSEFLIEIFREEVDFDYREEPDTICRKRLMVLKDGVEIVRREFRFYFNGPKKQLDVEYL